MSTSSTVTAGKLGQEVRFNGNDQYAVSSTLFGSPTQITLAAWVNITGRESTTGGDVISLGDNVTIRVDRDTFGIEAFYRYASGWRSVDTDDYVEDTGWRHIVYTVDSLGDSQRVYLDGVEIGATAFADDIVYDRGTQTFIGKHGNGVTTQDLIGSVDDVRIYNRVLTLAEIYAIHKAGQVTIAKTPSATRSGMPTGLVGHWTFDGADVDWASTTAEIRDKSGNGNHGNASSSMSASRSPTMGVLGQAMRFNNVVNGCAADQGELVNAGNASSLNDLTGLTYAAWIFPYDIDTEDAIIVKNSTTNLGKSLYLTTTGLAFYADKATTDARERSSVGISTTTWTHVAVTWSDGLAPKLYINGTEVSSYAVQTAGSGALSADASGPLGIGNHTTNTCAFYGVIDDARVYNRALTSSEVKKIYQDGTVTIGKTQTSLVNNGLVGFWSFNGPDFTDKVYDKSGNSNNGYVIGVATSSVKGIGKIGQGVTLNGSSHVDFGSAAALRVTDTLSLSAWIKLGTLGTDKKIAGNDNNVNGGYKLGVYSDDKVELEIVSSGGFSSNIRNTNGGTALQRERWYHVVGMYSDSGDFIQMYVDGALDRSTSTTRILAAPTSGTFQVGKEPFASSFFFNGQIDEVRIYNRILTPAEIKQLYNSGR